MMNHDIFISYSSKQKSIADGVCHYLEENGFKCWMAPRDIPAGSEYTDLIVKAIKSSNVVVLIYSQSAGVSRWVKSEINIAFSSDKPILPFRIDETRVVEAFEILNQIHWIDAFPQYAERLPDLLKSISVLLGRPAKKVMGSCSTSQTSSCPTGAINGIFSVSPTKKVYFSKGNLQYQASTGIWRFAEHQYDIVGQANERISPNNDGWIDLFGWGTWEPGNNPVNTSTDCLDYLEYERSNSVGCYKDNIINGGKSVPWELLSDDEWAYVFYRRQLTNDFSYAFAVINGVYGLVLLPDNWNENFSLIKKCDSTGVIHSFNSSHVSETIWNKIEAAGAVFLPAAGGRYGNEIWNAGNYGYYWTDEKKGDIGEAYTVVFGNGDVRTNVISFLIFNGQSVRLVCPI